MIPYPLYFQPYTYSNRSISPRSPWKRFPKTKSQTYNTFVCWKLRQHFWINHLAGNAITIKYYYINNQFARRLLLLLLLWLLLFILYFFSGLYSTKSTVWPKSRLGFVGQRLLVSWSVNFLQSVCARSSHDNKANKSGKKSPVYDSN